MAVILLNRTPRYFTRRYFKLPWLLCAVFLFFLWEKLPEPPKTANNNRMDRAPPQYNVAEKPQFLYHSQFRPHPDHAYEASIDNSLRRLEEETLAENEGNLEAPKTIWQIMLGANRKAMGRARTRLHSRNEIDNGNTRDVFSPYCLVTSTSAASFINDIFSEIPEIVRAYNSYPLEVLRADLLRYLILWYYGGFYADLDVYPARSIKSCPALNRFFQRPTTHQKLPDVPPNVSLVLGIEIDEPYASPQLKRDWHWSRIYGFVQYTMYAPKRFSPFLRRAIVRVLAHTRQHSQRNSLFSKPKYDETTILEITGPGVFTDAILDVLSETLPQTHPLITTSVEKDRDVGELNQNPNPNGGGFWGRVTWAPFHRLKAPLWVDASDSISDSDGGMRGLGVLPIRVWGNGQRHSEAGYFHDAQACVNHRFGRTWKKGWWEYFFG